MRITGPALKNVMNRLILAPLVVWLSLTSPAAGAIDSCRLDVDCPIGEQCVTGKGPCDGPQGNHSTCAVRSCRVVPLAGLTQPQYPTTTFREICGPAGGRSIEVQQEWRDPKEALWSRMTFTIDAAIRTRIRAGIPETIVGGIPKGQPSPATTVLSPNCAIIGDTGTDRPCDPRRTETVPVDSVTLRLQPGSGALEAGQRITGEIRFRTHDGQGTAISRFVDLSIADGVGPGKQCK